MLRLTFLLCCVLFVALQVGGRDYGQKRFGLQGQYAALAPADDPAPVQPAAKAAAVVPQAVVVAQPAPQPVERAEPVAQVLDAAFASGRPVLGPAPEPEPARQFIESPIKPVRYVNAAAVNVREGPSTDFGVVGRLTRGEAALVVQDAGDGWALIRIEGDGIEGYVSSRYLADALN
ncbi:SH3 domain-containing protein [Fertoebacter nigrum]|uniref:SH3 domain-containing protein n=1 Tax=Fertoeibacter niger TaxID=2656921 RepID=A0A8X8KN29_9RHOB|nr:SH3 domain-containing protein [Fertoeibacter niger]NUB44555.1 SH3 domain-containing protein [Fertoeibacter niger]